MRRPGVRHREIRVLGDCLVQQFPGGTESPRIQPGDDVDGPQREVVRREVLRPLAHGSPQFGHPNVGSDARDNAAHDTILLLEQFGERFLRGIRPRLAPVVVSQSCTEIRTRVDERRMLPVRT